MASMALQVIDPGIVATQGVERPGRRERLDPLPKGLQGDAFLIITNTCVSQLLRRPGPWPYAFLLV